MQFKTASFSLLSSSVIALSVAQYEASVYHPTKVSYETLIDEELFETSGIEPHFLKALGEYGILSITNIPDYLDHKLETYQYLHKCAVDSHATRKHSFEDGTVRLTMATRTLPGVEGQQSVRHDVPGSAACSSFDEASSKLRWAVERAIVAFSARLGASVLDLNSGPLLYAEEHMTTFDEFDTLLDVVKKGEHLEHFHSYVGGNTPLMSRGDTIDLHTDQGLLIAFVPALMADTSASEAASEPSQGDFFIERKDGSRLVVDFGKDDDLIIMLGDGVNQYINPKVSREGYSLRATPHALHMSSDDSNHARVWYGRMVLPPPNAVNPNSRTGMTFGQMRRLMIDASLSGNDQDSIGCASSSMRTRQLDKNACTLDEFYCWHQCYSVSVLDNQFGGVSEAYCASENKTLACVDTRDNTTLWNNSIHGAHYQPMCYDNHDHPPTQNQGNHSGDHHDNNTKTTS
eukprot:CAMPEP_0172483612 /NCGR_PEP_ID=MMETSP1066-20121228/10638_1 /TAXON_ID=671091 /ORGANISM="Coscinodiscus wailesii, Strain CCMP2513" /LENGTH=458 /DNA_ID=CAMNT_0013247557 /DNA_START=65 /DNA_END=1438 /DNA_ORIENTATION=+